MKLQTPVTDIPCRAGISYDDKILMLGSCFSDNIGAQLRDLGFNVCVNPFGTLYNPASVLAAVRRLSSGTPFTEEDCVEIGAGDGRICSFSHHTSFAKASVAEFIENANARLDEACEFFRGCNKVIITLGTAWCYRHLERGHIVSNCLKRHPKEFERELLSVDETAAALNEIMKLCPGRDFIFTVSPIRHFKDGAHGNQISKSTLLLGINNVDADYFPSYEIVMDELRDYRFYAEDMCHPTLQTVNYIRERFLEWALPAAEKDRLTENIRALKHSRHIAG